MPWKRQSKCSRQCEQMLGNVFLLFSNQNLCGKHACEPFLVSIIIPANAFRDFAGNGSSAEKIAGEIRRDIVDWKFGCAEIGVLFDLHIDFR